MSLCYIQQITILCKRQRLIRWLFFLVIVWPLHSYGLGGISLPLQRNGIDPTYFDLMNLVVRRLLDV
jgi:hypothetical protein